MLALPNTLHPIHIHFLCGGSVNGGLFLYPHIIEKEWKWKKKIATGTKKIENLNIDAKEYGKALEAIVIPHMKNNGLNQIISDGCRNGHTKYIKDLLNKYSINLYDLAKESEHG